MANENKVTIEVTVDAKDAEAAISQFGAQSVKSIKSAENAAVNFGATFNKALGPIAGVIAVVVTAVKSMSAAINGAKEDEKLLLQIGDALRITSENSEDARNSIIDFADAVKAATGVDDDLVKQLFINAKAFGITTDQAKDLTKAAIDYAAATGIDVETAATRLGQTLDGTVGKLANLGEEFRNLSETQLKNGEAIRLIADRYGGSAASQLNTFEGATNELANSISDLTKEFGKIITQSPNLIASLRLTAETLNYITGLVGDLAKGPVKEYNDQLNAIKAEKLVAANELVGNSSKEASVQLKELFSQTERASSSIQSFATFGEKLANTEIGAKKIGLTGKALEDAEKAAKKTREEFEKLTQSIKSEFGTEVEKATLKARESIAKLAEFEGKVGPENSKLIAELKIRIEEKLQQDLSKIRKDAQEKDFDDAKNAAQKFKAELDKEAAAQQTERDRVAAAGADPLKTLAIGGRGLSAGEFAGAGVGITNQILKGAEGAINLVSKGIGVIADSFIPGIGGAVTELANLLSRGPEATKLFIRQFVEAVPDIIVAIAESIPVVVEALVDSLILKGGIVRIAIALAKALSGQAIFVSIGKQLGIDIGEGAAEPFKQAAQQASDDANNARAGFIESFKRFINEIGPATGQALLSVFPTIQQGLSETFARSGLIISQAFQQFIADVGAFFSGFIDGLSQFTDIFKNLGDALRLTFEPITNGVKNLADSIRGLSQPIQDLIDALKGKGSGRGLIAEAGGKGGGSGVISETLGRAGLKFAGGTDFVNGPAGIDRVPAMLTRGERVVPVDTNLQLAQFLSKESSPVNSSDAILAQILSMVSAPTIVNTEVKVNQSAFADIILQLNRQNARLSA